MGNPLRRRSGARKIRRNTAEGAARFDRPQQGRTQGSDHDSLANGSRDRTLECDLVADDRVEQILRQCFAEFFERLSACVMGFPLNFNARRFDDSYNVGSDFGANAVAWNQCDRMHGSIVTKWPIAKEVQTSSSLVAALLVWRSRAASRCAACAMCV